MDKHLYTPNAPSFLLANIDIYTSVVSVLQLSPT